MPGNLLFADKQFPNITGNNENDLKAILNYMYMLQEQLRYTLGNISTENLNENDFTVKSENIEFDEVTTLNTLYADAIGANPVSMGYRWLSMLNGLNFGDSNLIDYESPEYMPFGNRSLNGLHVLKFNGDTVLDSINRGTTGNAPTSSETGSLMNWQSVTGAITQFGIKLGSVRNLYLQGQVYGDRADATGVFIANQNPDSVSAGNSYCQIQVSDAGIIVGRYRKESNGTWTTLSQTTLIS